MSEFILYHEGRYNIYGTVADGPYFTHGATLEQLRNWIEREHGQEGLQKLPPRLARAHSKGTSAIKDDSLADTILCNRAGPDEECLSTEEFIRQFMTDGGEQ